MNEIFNIKRFEALTLKFYRENMKANLMMLGALAVYLFLWLCDFNPFSPVYTETANEAQKAAFLLHYQSKFTTIFWVVFFIFSIGPALLSFKVFTSREKVMNAILLPASTFEKYLLGFLSTTVVFFIVYYLIFTLLFWVVSTYKYGGVEEMSFVTGWLGMRIPEVTGSQEIVRVSMPNVFHIVSDWKDHVYGDMISLGGLRVIFWNVLIAGWLFLVSVFMWGSITFRKKAALKVILLHTLAFIIVGYVLSKIGWDVIQYYALQVGNRSVCVIPDIQSSYKIIFLYLFPAAYFLVVWLKLKNKQIN